MILIQAFYSGSQPNWRLTFLILWCILILLIDHISLKSILYEIIQSNDKSDKIHKLTFLVPALTFDVMKLQICAFNKACQTFVHFF